MTTRKGYNRQPRSRISSEDHERYERIRAAQLERDEQLATAAGDRSGDRYKMTRTGANGRRSKLENKRSQVKGRA